MEEQKPHIVILPAPGMGHVLPHLQFAKRLATLHSLPVTFFVIPTDSSDSSSSAQSRHRRRPLPPNLRLHHLPPPDLSPLLLGPHTQIQTRISMTILHSLPHIESFLLSSPGPTVLVADFFATDALSLARRLRLPAFIFFTSPAAELAFMMHLPTLHRTTHSQFTHLTDPIPVPGCNPVRVRDLVEPVLDRSKDGYKWFLHHASRFPTADGIIINTCTDLEALSITALWENPILKSVPTPPVYPVGPVIDLEMGEIDDEDLKAWMDSQDDDSVVYVSFGSGGTLSREQIGELAHGLELSRRRFVWVVRRPFEEGNASGTYFDVGAEEVEAGEYLPDGFEERVRGVGVVVRSWAPQMGILRHRATGGFVSHCGWNSSLESVASGVPVVAWPLYAEQSMNAALLVEEVGVGVRVGGRGGGLVGREEIERAVRVVMGEEGEGIRERVREIGRRVMRGLEEGGGSFNSLCEVVGEWKNWAKNVDQGTRV